LPPNPAELLGSAKMRSVMRSLGNKADLVVYDSPPSVAVADAAILSSHADALLLVIETGRTRLGAVRTALDHASRSRTRLLGGVLNKVSDRGRGYHYYYYTQGYGSYHNGHSTEEAVIGVAKAPEQPAPTLGEKASSG